MRRSFVEDPSVTFDHVLCRELGWGSIEAMHDGMSNGEYRRWITFYRYEAWEREHANKVAEL